MQPYVMNDVIMHGEENEVVSKFLKTYKEMDGVFASGYTMAQVLYETAFQQNIDVPNDLQIISYDGAFKQWNNNRLLTCLEQPIEEMAREVVKLLVNKISGKEVPVRTMFQTSFVLGATTK